MHELARIIPDITIRMTEPGLHLGEVGVVAERIGRCGCSHSVCFGSKTQGGLLVPDNPVNTVGRDGALSAQHLRARSARP